MKKNKVKLFYINNNMSKICFPTFPYLISNVIIVIGIVYYYLYYYKNIDYNYCKETVINLQENIIELKKFVTNQKPREAIRIIKENDLETIPERRYIGPRDYDQYSQQVGFIYNETQRFPLYENRRGNRYYYHVIDQTRTGIRIVIETQGNRQLNDKEVIDVPELGSSNFTVKLYEYSGNVYNQFTSNY